MKKIKVAYIIWGVMAVSIIASLTWLGFAYKKKLEPYKEIEHNLTEMAEKYVELEFLYPKYGETVIVKSEDMLKKGLTDELVTENDKCEGYVKLTYKSVYKYKAYIKCGKYKTNGY